MTVFSFPCIRSETKVSTRITHAKERFNLFCGSYLRVPRKEKSCIATFSLDILHSITSKLSQPPMRWAQKLTLIALLSNIFSAVVFADAQIEQSVITTTDKKTSTTKYVWKISRTKFRLDISSSKGAIFYLFNGRILYVCSKANPRLLLELKKLKVSDQSFIRKITKGSCQAVPANFMARFFLSPAGAISTLDYSDGMQLTLGMDNYSFDKKGNGLALRQRCSRATRSFQVNRKYGREKGTHQTIKEDICYSNKYDWRKSFWRQISRNLIRQPQARGLYKTLKTDKKRLNGFVLSSIGTFEKTDSSGRVHKGKRTTKTLSIASKNLPARIFRLPASYAIVDIQSVILAQKLGDSEGTTKIQEADKDPIPVFLYHVLGGIL